MHDESENFTPNVHFELIPIKDLVSNQGYQRPLSKKHVNETTKHFDICQVNPIKISRRNGQNFVLNGQHTMEAIAQASGSRETPVWCMIYDDLEYEREADIFANQMKYTKPLRPYEIFCAKLEAGDGAAISIKALLDSYELTLTNNKSGHSTLCAISSVENIYNKYGYHVLDRTLYLIVNTWEGDAKSFSSGMLKGVARLISCFDEELSDEIFKTKLSGISLNEIARSAMERRSGSLGYAETLLNYYNKKCVYPLHTLKLYRR